MCDLVVWINNSWKSAGFFSFSRLISLLLAWPFCNILLSVAFILFLLFNPASTLHFHFIRYSTGKERIEKREKEGDVFISYYALMCPLTTCCCSGGGVSPQVSLKFNWTAAVFNPILLHLYLQLLCKVFLLLLFTCMSSCPNTCLLKQWTGESSSHVVFMNFLSCPSLETEFNH